MKKHRTPEEWHDYFEEHRERWESAISDIDTKVRSIYFGEKEGELPPDLQMMAAFFHAHYISKYVTGLLDMQGPYFPSDLLESLEREASQLGRDMLDEKYASTEDPEAKINMPGGDA